jgi:hypothetical protein
MHNAPKARPKSVILNYAIMRRLVAAIAALTVLSNIVPAQAAQFGGGESQMAMFLVPLSILMLAIIAEAVRLSGKPGKAKRPVPARTRPWTKGHE